jgi:hypothetical protein
MSEAIRWVIVGNHGLYVDQKLTRADIIAEHVYNRFGSNAPAFPNISQFPRGGKLSESQRKAWLYCCRQGDRAVKAKISWPVSKAKASYIDPAGTVSA